MADIAKLVVYFEGDTSDLDRAYDHAERRQRDYLRRASRQGDVELGADATPLEREIKDAQRTLSRYKGAATKNAMVDLDASQRPLERSLAGATATLGRWRASAGRSSTVSLDADTRGVTQGVDRTKSALSTLPDQKEINVDVDTGGAIAKLAALRAATMGSNSVVHGFNLAARTAENAFGLLIPAAIGVSVAALAPMIGGGVVGGGVVAGVVGGFGLIWGAARQTFSRIEVENGKFVAKTGATLTNSQKRLVDAMNNAGRAYSRAFAPANDAFNKFGTRIINRSRSMFEPLGVAAEESVRAVGKAFEYGLRVMKEPPQVASMERILDSIPRISARLTRAASTFGAGVANMLGQAAPLAEDLAKWVERTGQRFLNWTQSEDGRRQIKQWLEAAERLGPPVARAIGAIATGLIRLSTNRAVQAGLQGILHVMRRVGEEMSNLSHLFNRIGRVWQRPIQALKHSWEQLDMRWEGSKLQKLWQAAVRGVKSMANAHERIIKSFGNWLQKTWQRIWQGVANFLQARAKGMTSTLQNWRQGAVNWVKSLVPGVVNFWKGKVWQPAATFLADRAKGMSSTLSNWRSGAVSWVKSLPSRIGNLWEKFWQGAADFVVKKKDGIMGTMRSLVDGVTGLWNDLIGFINKVLSAVNLPTINIGGGSSGGSSGPTAGTVNAPGGGLNRPGAAKGGVTSGTYADAYRAFDVAAMARGGTQGPTGGLASGPRVVYGEAGPEAYVTLGRYTKESAAALRVANETWANRGWTDRMQSQGAHAPHGRHKPLAGVAMMASGGWFPKTAAVNATVENKFGVSGSTYAGHGADGQAGNSVDWQTGQGWGRVATGKFLEKGNAIVDYLLSQQKQFTDYIIWNKKMWDSGGVGTYRGGGGYAPPSDVSGWHQDHVHWESLEHNAGPHVGSGGFLASLWETVGEAIWNRLVGPIADKFEGWTGSGNFALTRAAGAAGGMALNRIKEWIISKAGASDSAPASGDHMQWHTEGLKYSGAFPVTDSNTGKLHTLAMKESSDNPNAKNPSGASGLMQMMPSTFDAYKVSGGDSIMNPIHNTAASARYQKDRYGSLTTQSPYRLGGIIPGPGGKPVFIQAHSGERILPRNMVESFDKLAHSINKWGKQGSRVSVGRQGVHMPGLSVTARGVQINARQLHRGAYAQEDAAKTLREMRKDIQRLAKDTGKEVQEGVRRNVEKGLDTNRALDLSDARRLARKLAGGPRISRAL